MSSSLATVEKCEVLTAPIFYYYLDNSRFFLALLLFPIVQYLSAVHICQVGYIECNEQPHDQKLMEKQNETFKSYHIYEFTVDSYRVMERNKTYGYVDNLLQNRLDRPGASIRRVGCGHILATEQRHPMQSREAEVWVE